MIKKTISKSGNIYYYEKVGIFSKKHKPTWEKIGQQRFDYYVTNHSNNAVKIERDSSNEVSYLEWNEKQNTKVDREVSDVESNNLIKESRSITQAQGFKRIKVVHLYLQLY